MKRLAIFCDGTWNNLTMSQLTNVARLAKCVESPATTDGVEQVVFYDPGVGVPSRISRVVDFLTGMMGGAFGGGIEDKIENAYRFLVLNYEPGDEIYIFGFSRGAYTARSLCGLIRKCGILRRDCFHMTPKAMNLYRTKVHPADVSSFRELYANKAHGQTIATGPEDLPDGAKHQWNARYPERRGDERGRSADDQGLVYKLTFLGLWDTVGALGIPSAFPLLSRLINGRFAFHDTNASGLITSLRHAVAVNEDRRTFDVTPVSNIHALNIDWANNTGRDVDNHKAPNFVAYPDRPYQQRWFPGDHGAVGGGNPERGLYSIPLWWIADGAQEAGLDLNRGAGGELAEALRLANPLADWRIDRNGQARSPYAFDMLGAVGGYRDRDGPKTLDEVHEVTRFRWRRQRAYRPAPLERFTGRRGPTPPYRIVARLFKTVVVLALVAALAWGLWRLVGWLAGLIPG